MRTIDSSPVLPQPSSVLWQAELPRLILASASAIRLRLLHDAGIAVVARPAAVDEAAIKCRARTDGASADETALLLADRKAACLARPRAIVIGADQLLACDGMWFDKPADRAAARMQLLALRGRAHVLHTALVVYRDAHCVWRHVSCPRLTMRAFSDAALESYLDLEGERLLCSVGAYRLEGPGVHLFDTVEGEHAAILGLPMLSLLSCLRQQLVLAV